MKPMWLLGLVLATFCGAGEIKDASLVGDRGGWRLEFDCSKEPLSRVWSPAPGIVRVEFQGFQAASAHRDFENNPWFETATVVPGRDVAYDFKLRKGAVAPSSWVRTWDGRHLRLALSHAAASHPFLDAVRQAAPLRDMPREASLTKATVVELKSLRLVSSQEEDVLELRFSKAPTSASLSFSDGGRRLDVNVGELKAGAKGGTLKGSWAVHSIATARNGVRLGLAETLRSATLNRMGDLLLLRMRRESNTAAGISVWEAGKSESFGGSDVPSDELQSLGKAVVEGPRKTFTPAASAPALSMGAPAAQDKDAAQLEAERRKSQEFTLKQKLEDEAKQSQVDQRNRIVYHTFGVRDPFIPLDPGDAESGLNIDQMKVVGIIFSKSKRMAVLEHVSQPGLSVALKEGDPIQNGKVLRIEKERVVFRLEEFGQTREFALRLQAPKGDRT